MGNPYIKPAAPPGYNNNPPSDDNAQTTDNQVAWQKHLDKIGNPLNIHTTGEADATENAFAARMLNGVIRTAVTYQVVEANRGKVVEGTADGIIINLPDVTGPNIGVGWEIAVSALINGGTGSITVKPSGAQTINGETELVFQSGNFALLTSDGTNWLALIHTETPATPAATQAEMEAATANDKMVTPLNTKWSPFTASAFAVWNGDGRNLLYSQNVSSIGGSASGDYVVNFTDAFANANYLVMGLAQQRQAGAGQILTLPDGYTPTTASCRLVSIRSTDGNQNSTPLAMAIFFGQLA